MSKPKILVILGPTSTGKSALGIELAQQFDGEIISADSRQVYRGLDISTGKETIEERQDIPHHLIDILDPGETFSVQQWKQLADQAIDDIVSRGRLPVIVGGTGFFIQALVDNLELPNVPPNQPLRSELEQLDNAQLLRRLQQIAADHIDQIDTSNRRRVIRAIEIAETLGHIPETKPQESPYEFLQIGLNVPREQLREQIWGRTLKRLKAGMVDEIKRVHDAGASWDWLESIGFDQKYAAQFLQGKMTKEQMHERILYGNVQYAKRQKTWFKRDQRIQWFRPTNTEEILKLVEGFLR